MLRLYLYARVHFCLRKSHARPRVQQAPGLPRALYFEEGRKLSSKPRTQCAARRRNCIHRHCEERSDEAIHLSACGAMDCFAALAMTATAVIVREGGRSSIPETSVIEPR